MSADTAPHASVWGRVLVVEDEAIIAMDLVRILRKLGCEIAGQASSGEDSIALAERLRPQLVFMDVRLKGSVNGLEAGREIWEKLRIPVVYLTAFGSDVAAVGPAPGPELPRVMKPFVEREIESVLGLFFHYRPR